MLRMSEVTTSSTAPCTKPLSANEIFRSLPATYNIPRHILDQYLTLLVDDPVGPPHLKYLSDFCLAPHKMLKKFPTFPS